jgi:hypothetical protein
MAGTHDTSVRSYRYYTRTTPAGAGPALTTDFKDCKLVFIDKEDGKTNFISQGIIISNDSLGNEIQFSFDGITVEGDLMAQETMNFFSLRRKVIYLKGQAGAEPYRLWAW